MATLTEQQCTACQTGAPPATEEEIANYLPQLPGWRVTTVAGVRRLEKTYQFKNFSQALHFTNQVGAIAEQAQHHPMLVTEWGQVGVSWWTHKIGGLHRNDFIMAAKTDALV